MSVTNMANNVIKV